MDRWKNLLIVAYLKESQESDAWKSRLEMLDLIIWSALPKSTLKEKKKLVDMLPTLISGIENGMKLLSMEESEQNEFLEKLASCHARAVNAEAYAAGNPPPVPVETDVGFLTKDIEVQAVPSAPIGPDLTATHQLGSLKVEDITILGKKNNLNNDDTGQSQPESLMVKIDPFEKIPNNELAELDQEQTYAPSEDEFTDIVKNLVVGIWFEFHHEDGAKTMERLSWISSVLGTYLFTNHDGLKTREMTAMELEESLRGGRVLLADDMSFLVDRTFNTLLGELQKKMMG